MPNNIDTRIVEMEFDNAQFERGAKQTLKTLDTLNQSLTFDNVAKGAKNLESAFNKLDFTSITNNIDLVGKSFTGLEAVAFGVSERIGNKIADLGMNIANELLVAQKKAGFAEYELELGSVQTIQASTGKDFKEIYGYLAELNKYADQTIYSFSDMTASIGKFTNSGVDLNTAVKAIQGISNEAALSGANAQEASHAMYNFAQALSTGYVQRIDWKSIENANMATVEFKQTLLDTALELGTVVKEGNDYVTTTTNAKGQISEAFNATKGFNDALNNQWMTSEVLTKALAKYSDETTDIGKRAYSAAQDVKSFTQLLDTLKEAIGSGWAETFRLIFGEFKDAKKLWTGVSNVLGRVIDRFSDARNHMLRFWKQEGGRTKLLNSLIRLWKIFEERVKVAINAFSIAFPIFNKTGHVLMNLTKRFQRFTINLKKQFLGNAQDLTIFSNKIIDVLSDVKILATSISKDILPILSWLFMGTGEVINALMDPYSMFRMILHNVIGEVSKFTAALSEMFWNFDSGEPAYAVFYDTILGISYVLQTIRDLVIGIIRFATKNVEALYWITDSVRSIAEIVISVFGQLSAAFGDIFIYEDESTNWFSEITKNIAMFLRKLSSWVKGSQTVYLLATLVFKILKGIFVILKSVAKGVSSIFNPFGKKGQKGVYSFLDAVINLVDRFVEFISQSHIIEKAIAGIGSAFIGVAKFIKGLTGKSLSENLIDIFDFFININKKVDFESIGRRITKLADKIVDSLQWVWEEVLHLGDENSGPRKLVEDVKKLIKKFTESGDSAEESGKRISDSFKATKKKVNKHIKSIIEFLIELKNTVELIADTIKFTLEKLGTNVSEAIVFVVTGLVDEKTLRKLEESETFIGDAWIKLKEIALTNKKGIGKGNDSLNMDKLKEKLYELYEGLKEAEWLINLIVDLVFKMRIANATMTFAKGIKAIGDGTNNLSVAVKTFSYDVGRSLKKFMVAKQIEAIASLLIAMSVAFLTLFAIMVGVTAIFEFGSEKTIKNFKMALIGVTVALILISALIVAALWKLNSASQKNTKFVEALEAFSKVMFSIAAVMLSFAAAVAILGYVYSRLGGTEFALVLGSIAAFMSIMFIMLAWIIELSSKNDNIKYGIFDAGEMFREMSKVLISMGAAMLMMAGAMFIIGKIPKDSILLAITTIVGIWGMITLLLYVLTKNANTDSIRMIEGLDKVVIAIGKTMILIAVAIKIMTKVVSTTEPDKLGIAVGILGLFMVIMGAMVVFASKYASSHSIATIDQVGNLATKLAFSMILLSVAIGIIGMVFKSLKKANIDIEYLWLLFGIVGALGGVLALLGSLSKAIPGGALAYILIATAMVIMSGSVYLLAKALEQLEKVDMPKVAKGLSAMGKTSGWITLLGLSMIVLATGALALGVGLSALMLPLLVLWPIIQEFIDYWPKIQEMFNGASEGTDKLNSSLTGSSFGASIGEKLGAGLRDLVKVIKKYAPEIIKDVIDIMSMIVRAFFIPLQALGKGIIDTLAITLNYVNNHIDEILTPLGQIILKVCNFLKLYAPIIAETVALLIFYVFNGAFMVLAAYAGILADSLYKAIAALLEAFGDQLTGEKNARIAAAIAKIVDGLFDLIKKTFAALSQTEMAEAGANLIDSLVEGIKAAPNKLKKALNDVLGVEIFDVGEDLDLSLHDGEVGWRIKDGQWIYDDALAEIQQQQKEAERIRSMTEDTLAGGGGSSTTVNSPYDTSQMEAANKEAAEYAEEVTKTVTDTAQEELEKETDKNLKIPGLGEKVAGAFNDEASNVDFTAMSKQLKDTFDVTKFIPNSEEMTSGFTNSFGGMPDISTMMTNAGVDTSVELEPVYNMDNAKIMQDGQLSDFEGFDSTMLMGETSTDYSQTVSQTQNTEFNDETKATYEKLKAAVDDLTAMLSNVTIISDDATISASVDLDGEKVGELMVPVVDAKLTQGGKKAKTKTAQ